MIRVLLAEDQPLIRGGIKAVLELDGSIEVVGTAGNGLEAFQLCETLRPDVVLMDIKMPVCDGIEGTRLIKGKYGLIKVIILTIHSEDEIVMKALSNGADGYVLKDIRTDVLILTIKSAVNGLKVMQQDVFNAAFKSIGLPHKGGEAQVKKKGEGLKPILAEREIKIIRLVVLGKSYKEIAAEIHLSEGRVKNIVSDILRKMKLKDRAQLVVYAVKNDII